MSIVRRSTAEVGATLARSSVGNRKSSIENSLRLYLTVIDRNPEAVEKALMNKS
jgi:hypothetical protein